MLDCFLLLMALIIYLIVAWISHYDSGLSGSGIPDDLCVFCLFERGWGRIRR